MRVIMLLLLPFLMVALPSVANEAQWRELTRAAEQDPKRTLADATRALSDARARGDKAAQVHALRLRVIASCMGAALDVDPQDVDTGLALAREVGDMDSVAWFLYEKAWLAFEADGRKAADELIDQGIAVSEQHRLEGTLPWMHLRRGEIRWRMGLESDAMDWVSKAYAGFQHQRDALGMASSLKMIMRLHSGEQSTAEDKAKAVAYGKQALSLLDTQVYRSTATGLNNTIGTVYFNLRDLSNAQVHLELALADARALAHHKHEGIADLQYKVARLAQEQGRFADALGALEAALPVFEQLGRKRRVVQTLVARAEVLAQLGRRPESLQALSDARPIVLQADSLEASVFYHERAAEIHAKAGNTQDALREMTALRDAERRLAEAANSKLTSELKVRFDVALTEQENALLRAKEEESEARRLNLILALVLTVVVMSGLGYYLRRRAVSAEMEARHHKALADAESAANQAKGAFLANMSHELRTPLNAMLGFTRILIRSDNIPAAERQDLGIVLRSGEHLCTLINQVLDMSKLEASRARLVESELDVPRLVDELHETFAVAARDKGLALLMSCGAHVPSRVRVDAVKLRQILINLVGNAVKFTSQGRVELHVSPRHQALEFLVMDTGVGIAAPELAQLGQPFVQAQSGHGMAEGTGLGLAISRGFVKLMGGELELSSVPGEGTRARFVVPVEPLDPVAVAVAQPARRVTGVHPDTPAPRVLVADDRPDGRALVTRLLEPIGFEVREAGDGEKAVAVCQTWQPQLVLMDMRMPVMDGREATRRIKAAAQGRKTVVIALTASSFEEERAQILAAGCDDFVLKPFDEDVLLQTIGRHLGLRYTYQFPEPASERPARFDPSCVRNLPGPLVAQLRHALSELDVQAVESGLEAIRRHDADAADALAALAARFQYARMATLLSVQAQPDQPVRS